MRDHVADHLNAAARHEMAAENHQRASRFWADRGDRDRAALQREMADYERRGATLERRWADLVDPSKPASAARGADLVLEQARQGAKQLSTILARTADALERTAELAETHAQTSAQAGGDNAAEEREAAARAREAAQRARSQAEEWLKASKSLAL